MSPKHTALTGLVLTSVYVGGRSCTGIWVHKAVTSSVFPSNKRLSLFSTQAHTVWMTQWQSLVPSIKKGCTQERPIAFKWHGSPGSTGAAVQKASAADWCAEPVLPPDHVSGFNLRACVQAPIPALPLMNNLAVFCFKAMNDWTANPLEADESTPRHCR